MIMQPKRTKYRKRQKGQMRGLTKAGQFVEFGDFGMQALGRGRITARQIEACRVAINRRFNRKGKVWIRVFPSTPITKKPAEVRMGKGKGGVEYWCDIIRPGKVLFEVGNVTREDAQAALRLAAAKLNIRTRFVDRLERV